MALEASALGNMCLVAPAREIVSEALPHILNGVDLDVLHPVIVFVLRVEPE